MNGHLQELKCGSRPMNKKKLEKELHKYKSLYENEKDHTDTLKRIIKKVEEYVKELYDNTDDTTCYDIDRNSKEYLLDLLKEIKLYEKI